ncbi:MAG: alginate lyase family protein [Melioribacteraceae bacterium]|nr:alginate lyase family protein [Melioribacteraceae bacterium]
MNRLIKSIFMISILFLLVSCAKKVGMKDENAAIIIKTDSVRIITSANQFLKNDPIPLTNFSCERSLGTKNDFYSEGDYWWPNPEDPDGPYIRRDGMSNPGYFKEHREAMRNMSIQVASLVAAYKITNEKKYADQAIKHLYAWFIEPQTKMNPNMNYSQAIKGICPGRGVGLIDAIHLVEPARAVSVLNKLNAIDKKLYTGLQSWFAELLEWMNTHEYGIDERERKNNHGTCWVMQAAEFAKLTCNEEMLKYCIDRYKTVLLPNQMSMDGSFYMELERTKPYGYSLFNIDIMATVCHILSDENENLFAFKLEDGRGMELALNFIYPFIKDKSEWPFEQDIMYWDEWPVRHPALLFGGFSLKKNEYIDLWKVLEPLPKSQEGLRNFPVREPVLWIE